MPRRYDWILAHQDKPNAYNKPSPVTRVSRRPLYLSARHAIRFNPACSSALLAYVFSARHFPRSTHPTQLDHLPAILFGHNVTGGRTTTTLSWQPHEEWPLASGWAPRYAGRSTAQADVFSPPAKMILGQSWAVAPFSGQDSAFHWLHERGVSTGLHRAALVGSDGLREIVKLL